jgi:hypothetical protein
MRNTIHSGQVRILIYRNKEGYIGICYETGMVDVWPTIEETKKHLLDGTLSLIEAVTKGELTEDVLNTKPPLKYRLIFRLAPIAFAIAKLPKVSLFTEPFHPRFAGNA